MVSPPIEIIDTDLRCVFLSNSGGLEESRGVLGFRGRGNPWEGLSESGGFCDLIFECGKPGVEGG